MVRSRMASNLIAELSPNQLKAQLDSLMAANDQPLLPDAKQFLAVAGLQGFDVRPRRCSTGEIEKMIAGGHQELNRGLRPSSGQPASFYANQLFSGPLYPGSEVVYGHGMYFAEPSECDINPANPNFPRISEVALKYATRDGAVGVVVRGVLDLAAKTATVDDLREDFKGDKNRRARAGISDLGVYAAALGIDAFSVEEAFDYSNERTWIILNRSAVTFQNSGLRIADPALTSK